jgi:hypothetical protein
MSHTIIVRLRVGGNRSVHKRWDYANTTTELEKLGYRTEKGGHWETTTIGPEPSSYRGPAPFAVVWISEKNNTQTDIYKEFTFNHITLGKWVSTKGANEHSFNRVQWYRDTITEFSSKQQSSDDPLVYDTSSTPFMIEFLQGPMGRDPHAPSWTYPTVRFIPVGTNVEEGFACVRTQGPFIRFIKKIPLSTGQSTGES